MGERRLPVTVSVLMEPRGDYMVSYAKVKYAETVKIWDIKITIARLMGLDRYRISLFERSDPRRLSPLPDWLDAYGDLTACISPANPILPTFNTMFGEVQISVQGRAYPFIMAINLLADHRQFLSQVADITGLPHNSIDTVDRMGQPWTYPEGMSRSPIVHVIPRGGMHSGLSPTQAFNTDEDELDEALGDAEMHDEHLDHNMMEEPCREDHEPLQYHEQPFPEWPHDRARSATPKRDAARSSESRSRSRHRERPWDDETNTVECIVWPRTEDLPRPPMVTRPIMIKGERVAQVSAYAQASPPDVLAQLHLKVQPMRPFRWIPKNAIDWGNVGYVVAQHMEKLNESYYDLRRWPFEHLKAHRCIPVVHRGEKVDTVGHPS